MYISWENPWFPVWIFPFLVKSFHDTWHTRGMAMALMAGGQGVTLFLAIAALTLGDQAVDTLWIIYG